MFKQLRTLPYYLQHIISILATLLYMLSTVIIPKLLPPLVPADYISTISFYLLLILLVSHFSVTCIYSAFCSFYTVFVLWKVAQNGGPVMSPRGYVIFFLVIFIAGIMINLLSSRLFRQSIIISEREAALAEAEKEKMRANLLRAVSHDLRTPLTGIIGNSMAYLENQTSLSEKEKTNIVTNIYEDSTWLINMVENLLTVTRIKDRELIISTQEEPLEEVIGEALNRMEQRHPDCVIHATIPEDFIMLPMDAILIEQVIINLLENAMRHSHSTEPIDLIVLDENESVSITIKDYGTGIPEEMLPNLFSGTDYTSVGLADTQKGLGIGLAICKTIITAHHGTLTGRNHSQGAEFIFTLPKRTE